MTHSQKPAQSLYAPDVGRCGACGTTRPGNYLTAGVCNDDWHGRLKAPEPPDELLEEFHAPKKKPAAPRRTR